jgi:hypothetical protein
MDDGQSPPLTDAHLPATFQAADKASVGAQARFLRLRLLQLASLGLAAICGAITLRVLAHGGDLAATVGAAAFVVAGAVTGYLLSAKPEQSWYDARAVAESAKTLAWRYAVGGSPFPVGSADGSTESEFLARLRQLPDGLPGGALIPPVEGSRQITAAMRDLRSESLGVRQAAYRRGRVANQQTWYAHRARRSRRRADSWNLALLAAEASAAVGAVLKAAGIVEIDLLGISGAVIAGATAWLQTKQHEMLATQYTVASLELAAIAELMPISGGDQEWAEFVDQAEEAISREHIMWKASRTRLGSS